MEQSLRTYFRFISAQCNVKDAYFFDDTFTSRIGHLVALSFPSCKKELKADTHLRNPENPNTQTNIVGVIESIFWSGNPQESIEMGVRVSPENRAILLEALSSMTETAHVEAQWVVYEYDFHNKKYFKRFYTTENPVKLIIPETAQIYVDDDPAQYPEIRKNFAFQIPLAAKTGEPQTVGYSFSATGAHFTRRVGV